ncbi:MAG: hypothetical protein JMHAAFGB_00128 [Dehalococcoides mccartyi]|nr:hypothetical protein [Dehalococcoides mccartyi]
MQGLISVRFGVGYIIIKRTRYGVPQTVDNAYGMVTVRYVIYQHSQGEYVINIFKLFALGGILFHFLINAVKVFGAAGEFHLQPVFFKFALKNGTDVFNIIFALGKF